MVPKFFKHTMREVGSFLRIMKGKATKNDQARFHPEDDALREVNRDIKNKSRPNEKILRTEVDRDISAI